MTQKQHFVNIYSGMGSIKHVQLTMMGDTFKKNKKPTPNYPCQGGTASAALPWQQTS